MRAIALHENAKASSVKAARTQNDCNLIHAHGESGYIGKIKLHGHEKEENMKVYEVKGTEVKEGIEVALKPYPHMVLGEGGHKRATWIALGKRDVESIISPTFVPCPNIGYSRTEGSVCEKCGVTYVAGGEHPKTGRVAGPDYVFDVGVIALKDDKGEPNGKYLIVAPRNADNRVLILWRVSSGYRGGASITAGEGVTVIASDSSWHSGRGNLGETAEMLVILRPGQELRASRSGRRVQDTSAKLTYDGTNVSVTFGGEEMEAATANEVEGEYL